MIDNSTINHVLTRLGFEDCDADFVADVARLAEAGDPQGLANLIAGNASWGEALETANSILARLEEAEVEDGHDDGGVSEVYELCDYVTGEYIRQASKEEMAASLDAAERDGGAGVIDVDGRRCFVR